MGDAKVYRFIWEVLKFIGSYGGAEVYRFIWGVLKFTGSYGRCLSLQVHMGDSRIKIIM